MLGESHLQQEAHCARRALFHLIDRLKRRHFGCGRERVLRQRKLTERRRKHQLARQARRPCTRRLASAGVSCALLTQMCVASVCVGGTHTAVSSTPSRRANAA
jgi:hypothetical protein